MKNTLYPQHGSGWVIFNVFAVICVAAIFFIATMATINPRMLMVVLIPIEAYDNAAHEQNAQGHVNKVKKWLKKQDNVTGVSIEAASDDLGYNENVRGTLDMSDDLSAADACSSMDTIFSALKSKDDAPVPRGYNLNLYFRWEYHGASVKDRFPTIDLHDSDHGATKSDVTQNCNLVKFALSAVDGGARKIDIKDNSSFYVERDYTKNSVAELHTHNDGWDVVVGKIDDDDIEATSELVNNVISIPPFAEYKNSNPPTLRVDFNGETDATWKIFDKSGEEGLYLDIDDHKNLQKEELAKKRFSESILTYMKKTGKRKVQLCFGELFATHKRECEDHELKEDAAETSDGEVGN